MNVTLSAAEARQIICGDHRDYKVIETTITGTGRWSIYKETIIQRISDGKYFRTHYSEGATEAQDEQPYDWGTPEFTEVKPITRTITIYE